MTNGEHVETNVAETGDDDDASSDVYRAVNESMDDAGATHVDHLRGNEDAFRDVLAIFVGRRRVRPRAADRHARPANITDPRRGHAP